MTIDPTIFRLRTITGFFQPLPIAAQLLAHPWVLEGKFFLVNDSLMAKIAKRIPQNLFRSGKNLADD